jgi:hypothetical protein
MELEWTVASIHADLSVGVNVIEARPLIGNSGIAHDGVKLHGKGFALDHALATMLGLGRRTGLERYIRPYRNGKDLTHRSASAVASKFAIDAFGLDEKELRGQFPEVYQHLLQTVKPERDGNRRPTYRDNWWIFGEPRRELRPALFGLHRYIATIDTAKFRTFMFLSADILCDDGAVIIAAEDAYTLGVLQWSGHEIWSLRMGGWMGVGNHPRYNKSRTFDPFPFPDPTPQQRTVIADVAEELDATRKAALAEHPRLTMTGLYNLVEKLRAGAALTPAEEADARDARARIVLHLHAELDRAVAAAYG